MTIVEKGKEIAEMNEMKLRYDSPAERWEETLPIGNGSLGAMIFGGEREDVLGLNEESLWSGYYKDKNKDSVYESLQSVRSLIFSGKAAEAEKEIQKKMLGEYNESYLPLGNLSIMCELPADAAMQEYCRSLSLDRAVAQTSFTCCGVRYEREYFASYPARAILVRLRADRPVLKCGLSFSSMLVHSCKASEGELTITGSCPEHVDPSYIPLRENSIIQGTRGMEFKAGIRILSCDGRVTEEAERLVIENASECVIAVFCSREPKLLQDMDYEMIKEEHIHDYRRIYAKTELYLGEQPDLATDQRLENLKNGKEDNGLFALFFQYGRYLLISSSREGSLPANLQGIWSWELRAPWSSNYTVNINTQMNYWPALSCNLEECMEPYYRFMEDICEEGKKTAAVNYHCRGFAAHHNIDHWKNTNPVGVKYGETEAEDGSVNWAFWPMGGAWMAQELYYAYEYNQDEEYLEKTALPVLREAALFLNDWLVEHDGKYVTCPSISPENRFLLPDGGTGCVTYASAMDMSLVKEAFTNYRKICDIQGRQDGLYREIEEKMPKLAPVRTGSYGQILEWYEEYEEAEPGHRHLSHLYGLFPAELFAGDDRMEEACRISLAHRLANGGGHTGWSCAWIINLFAVLKDGEQAWKYLHTLLTRSAYPNLWDAHPPFQIDGNFGGTAGIANMLVQDRGGKVSILPALPKQFQSGYVKGLCIKGRKAVDIAWENGKEVSHRIYGRQ